MRLHRARAKTDEERILPLINVVFLLLIFFMIAGRLSASDPFPVTPPSSRSEAQPELRRLTVLIGADGALAVDGVEVEEAALELVVSERLEAERSTRIQLKADGGVSAQRAVAVMERLRTAGVDRLHLLTIPAPGPERAAGSAPEPR